MGECKIERKNRRGAKVRKGRKGIGIEGKV